MNLFASASSAGFFAFSRIGVDKRLFCQIMHAEYEEGRVYRHHDKRRDSNGGKGYNPNKNKRKNRVK